MNHLSERACFINSIEHCKSPEKPFRMDGDQSVSPVLSRGKKYYRSSKRGSKGSLDKGRFTSSAVQDDSMIIDQVSPSKFSRIKVDRVDPALPEYMNQVSNKFKSDILSKIYDGFKTATGKNLAVSDGKVRYHGSKVFGDILTATPAPLDQNILNKSDSISKRSFLTRVNVPAKATAAGNLEIKSASGDRPFANDQGQSLNRNIPVVKSNENDSMSAEELAKCFESDVFSQLPSKEFCRLNRAAEVYSNTNYNDLSTDSETLPSVKNLAVKKPFDINEISDSELVYLADTAEYLSAQKNHHKSPKLESSPPGKSSPKVPKLTLKAPLKHEHKSHNKHSRLKQVLSKNLVDPSLSPSILDTHSPALAKNIYELHRNTKFTNESDHQVLEKNHRHTDGSLLTNLMKIFGVKSQSPKGYSQEEIRISQEVFDRHSKVLEAVVHTMQADEELQQKKQLKKVKHQSKVKSKEKSSQRDKDSTKRKVVDRCISPVEVKEEQQAQVVQEIKRCKSTTKCLIEDIPQLTDIAKVENETPHVVSPTNKKLQIEIGSTNIKININSTSLNEPQIGYRSSSGRDITLTPFALEAAKHIIHHPKPIETIHEEVEAPTTTDNIKNFCSLHYPSDTDSISTIHDKNPVKLKPVVLGFSSASGNKINVTAKSMRLAQDMYQQAIDNDKEIKFDLLNSPDKDCADKKVGVMFTVASDQNKDNDLMLGFSTAAGANIAVTDDKITSAKRLFDDIDAEESCLLTAGNNTRASAPSEDVDEEQVMLVSDRSLKSAHELIGDAVSSMDTALFKLSSFKTRVKPSTSRKRLGMTSAKCKPITISKHSLEKAKSFFDDSEDLADIEPDLSIDKSVTSDFEHVLAKQSCQSSICSGKSSRLPSPIKSTSCTTKILSPSRKHAPISPIRELNIAASPSGIQQINIIKSESIPSRTCSPIRKTTVQAQVNMSTPSKGDPQQNTSFHNLNITPIKPNSRQRSVINRVNLSTIQESPSLLLTEQSSSDLSQIKADLDEECEILKKKLIILNDRKSALDLQESIISTSPSDYKKPKPGILYLLKQRSNRVPLKDLQLCSGENLEYFNVDPTVIDLNLKIADQVHFTTASVDSIGATIKTKDGAIIVPSVNDSIGLTEITRGFQTMPGVDPALIPKLWIDNHFKMIVWKLASYERIFPHYFKNTLCLENVVQQLKYRYDREIDQAERSSIRKITEKDDVPQKRMVLCVANIHEIAKHTFELDLSDGWYLIRTTIDVPLCKQVVAGKILLGTKLMIQNAELVHCEDGSHPLDLPEHVRLKINMNSTRRSTWYAKLGYQKHTRPLPIRIATMHHDGGQIANVKVYINRVYPVRYLECDGSAKVWRNPKAEEKQAQEFERDKYNRVQKIQDRILQGFSKATRRVNNTNMSRAELLTITCPEQLHDLLEGSRDPESFVERLTASQRSDLMSYMQSSNLRKQEEVLAKVAKEVTAQKVMERNVTGVLRLLVTDYLDNKPDGVILNIWRPTEDLLDSLVEDCVVSVFNVVPNKIRNELSSTQRTYFKVEETDCQRNNRQIVPIAMTVDSYYKPAFNEMDTVGLVVQIHVEKHRQELWLCDYQARLLLVQVHDGPKYCSLLDNITRGDCLAILNVLVSKPHKGYGQCVANQLSIITTYPQIKSHRESLEIFKQRLPKDLEQLLTDCDVKIEKHRISAVICNRGNSFLSSKMVVHTSFDDYVDEEAFSSSGLTAADVALSMLQIDIE